MGEKSPPLINITEKKMSEQQETYAQRAEIWNSRTAMVGVVAGLVSYALTGNLFFGIY